MGQSQRRKKKTVLCVSGMTGCGKSTLAKRIAKKYKLRYFSGGDALKAVALGSREEPLGRGWWESKEGMRFLRQRMGDFSFDLKVDEQLMKWAKQGDVVLDSWTMPWLLKGGFKIWLEASAEERARRIAKRNRTSFEEAHAALKEKDENTKRIYAEIYGFRLGEDLSPFDLILDVNHLDSEEVFQAIDMALDHVVWATQC